MTYSKTRAGRSWHLVTHASRIGQPLTRCGRLASGERRSDLPLDEKSCETCLRLAVRDG